MAGDDPTGSKGGGEGASGVPLFRIDPSSPYYLGSSDNPGNIITSVVFKGENFDEWSSSILLSLVAKRKDGFLDGSIPKPTEKDKLANWKCVHATLIQWILQTIEPSLRKTIPRFSDAKALWDSLKERFSVGDATRVQQIKSAMADCRQTKGMAIVEYYGKLQALWDDQATYDPMETCECGKCDCNLPAKLQKKEDNARFHQFLWGLNQEMYGTVRSTLLAQNPLPTLARAYQTLLQEERIKNSSLAIAEREETVALAVKTPAYNNKGGASGSNNNNRSEWRDKNDLLCTQCGCNGHEEHYCWEKVGFPEWHHRSRGGGAGRGSGRSGTGRGGGGRGRSSGVEVRGPVTGQTATTQQTAGQGAGSNGGGVPNFTQEQWQQLAAMIGSTGKSQSDRVSGLQFEDPDWSR